MKVQRIVETEVSLSQFISHLLHGGPSRLSEVVLPLFAIGDAVRFDVPHVHPQDGIGVVTDILPYDSDEHGDARRYSIRYADEYGYVRSIDAYEAQIEGCILPHGRVSPPVPVPLTDERIDEWVARLGEPTVEPAL